MRYGERRYGAPIHPNRIQLHVHELQALMNSMGCNPREGNALERQSHGGAMAGMPRTHQYSVPGRQLLKRGHGEAEKLTTSRMEGVAVSGKAPKGWVVDDGD